MATQLNVHEAKTHLSRVLEQALGGEDVIIMRAGTPLVRLTPVERAPFQRTLGTARGMFVVPDNFNEPLPDDVLNEFEK